MKSESLSRGPILIVDDEQSLRDTFHFFLTRDGYTQVFTAPGFKEALELFENNNFDLIMSDIVLEGASGIDLLKHVRRMDIECPFIIVTGYPEVDTAAEAVRSGAFDYITKPVDKDTLLKTVRHALHQRDLETQKTSAEEERERYRTFLDKVFKSVSDAIIIVDSGLQIIKMNAAARDLFTDLLPGVVEGSNLSSSLTSKELSPLRSDLLRVLKTGEEVTEHRFECETIDHALKVLSICTSPFIEHGHNSTGAVIVIRDMSIEKEMAPRRRNTFHRFVGSSDAMQTVYTTIENVGRVDTTVLITGESGTGKELAAEALHNESNRKERPLIKLDCTAMPENLLESELFGHKKGSFTGAEKDRQGHILQADGGTLFLDEIGEISAVTQLRLLRFLQEKTFHPVGSDTPIVVDTRIIAATNVELKDKVVDGSFREDLYFRLKVIDVNLPPLRKRGGDMLLLANHFVLVFSKKLEKSVIGLSDNALACLARYDWPGNVRELEHVIERAAVLCQGPTITRRELPQDIVQSAFPVEPSEPSRTLPEVIEPVYDPISHIEDPVAVSILKALTKSGGNKAKAARILGIDRSTLYRKIREHNVDVSIIAVE
ncbi:MAG: response regulator [Desulfobulbaceae bacterium]|nr:MAG: response regulator [Desulfobulbaceae bacterium]